MFGLTGALGRGGLSPEVPSPPGGQGMRAQPRVHDLRFFGLLTQTVGGARGPWGCSPSALHRFCDCANFVAALPCRRCRPLDVFVEPPLGTACSSCGCECGRMTQASMRWSGELETYRTNHEQVRQIRGNDLVEGWARDMGFRASFSNFMRFCIFV